MVMCQIQWLLLWVPAMRPSPSRLTGVVLSGGWIFLSTRVLPDVHGLGKGNLTRVPGYCRGWAQTSMSYLKAKHAVWPLQACAEAARGMYTRENVCMYVRVLDWLLCRTPEASEERRGLQVFWASTWQAGPAYVRPAMDAGPQGHPTPPALLDW